MIKKEQIIAKYLSHRWYKKTLVITSGENANKSASCFYGINSLKTVVCSGYLKTQNEIGCIFELDAWPFEYKCFNLVIIDESFVEGSQWVKALLEQIHFCLSDDGEVIIAGTKNIRAYSLISRFISNGFVNKKIELINSNENIVMNLVKRFFSKNFVALFKKDNFFNVANLEINNLIKKTTKSKVYRRINAREVCKKDCYERK